MTLENKSTLTPGRDRHRPGLVLLLAVACGIAVANIYYAQPLLTPIAGAFGITAGHAALAVTLTQIGYAAGLALLLPLGDLVENRTLVSRILLVTTAASLAVGLAPTFGVFAAAGALLGFTSVVAQILVAYAAHVAPDERRGATVGAVMTGLLLGILLARTISSLAAAVWGWRAIYFLSAGLALALAVLLRRALPVKPPAPGVTYPRLMASLAELARTEPVLRRRAVTQALVFGAFSAFWTSVGVELAQRHHLGQAGIALFALVGAAGAAGAPIAGRLGDRGWGTAATGAALAVAAASLVLAWLQVANLVLLAVTGVVLDVAVQCHLVLSQREIYALRPDSRARITTVFMTTVFLGGAVGSGVSGLLFDGHGWAGVTLFATALTVAGLLVWAAAVTRGRTTPRRRPPYGSR
ncbi:MFS transporter [Actinoplanes sp. NPDC049548]|uniref:MFS transporter n=1 Tax=Actinoplanes sp. NPDC049548 TaxID=3155152 RepID=UPI00343AB8E3